MKSATSLYISYDGMTDPLGQSQVLPYLAGLSAKGHRIVLISFEKQKRFNDLQERISTLCRNAGIRWIPLMYHQKPPVLSTLYDIWLLNRIVGKVSNEIQPDIVHCRSYIAALVGLTLKKKHPGIRFIFDMRGFWADERVDGKIWNLNNPVFLRIYKFFKRKEISFIKYADATVSLTHSGKAEIYSWPQFIHMPPPVYVIPCCADLDVFNRKAIEPAKLAEMRSTVPFPDDSFIITYVGSLGTWYMLPEMLDFFKVFQCRTPQARLLIITPDDAGLVDKQCLQSGVDRKLVHVASALRNEVPYYLSIGKFSIFFIKPAYSKKASSPTKLAEIMGMGIPVVCNDQVGDVAEIVSKYHAGAVISGFSENAYLKASEDILSLLNQPGLENKIASAAGAYASLEYGVEQYDKIYSMLLQA